ncbi:MAG: intermembrane transport protein PqiB [Aestuariibacter sp.]
MSNDTFPEAEIEPVKTISKIWVIPIIAILVGAWMIYFQLSNKGTEITIYFSSAEGLEAGKTKIRTRYVDVGEVTDIQLRKQEPGVAVKARIYTDAEYLLREDSNFWIVTPKISLSGISGLGTILSGPYIEMAPGMSGVLIKQFEGLEESPVTPAGTPGLHVTLNSDAEFAYKEGDPIIYKGLNVGKFEDIYFNFEERVVYYNAFIRAPYHELITTTTRFWDVSGVRLNLTADGVSVHTGSAETLLTNGVAFGIPEGSPRGEVIDERAYFDIHENYKDAVSQRYRRAAQFVMLVQDTVRGLRIGAPVEYRGLKIGEVLDINIPDSAPYSVLEESYKIPILFSIQPGRVGLPDTPEGVAMVNKQIETWVRRGLRASLKTGNLITGGQFVDLQNYLQVEPEILGDFQGYNVIPAISNEFTQITQKLSSILDKINELPLQSVADNLDTTLTELGNTATTIDDTATQLQQVITQLDQEQLVVSLNKTIQSFQLLADSYAEDSHTNQALNEILLELQTTMLELKPILNQLNQAPNSLIFAPENEGEHVYPKAKQ